MTQTRGMMPELYTNLRKPGKKIKPLPIPMPMPRVKPPRVRAIKKAR